MKTLITPQRARLSERAGISLRGLLLLCGFTLLPLILAAVPPAWWQSRGVLDPNQQADDYAAVNTGQLKHIAKQAMLELDAKIPGGAGTAIHQIIDAWPGQTTGRDDFAAVNIGQVKRVAKLIYDRLNAAGYTQPYPWGTTTTDRDDFAGVNVGQLKAVFAFCVDCAPGDDADSDGLLDWWEIHWFGNITSQTALDDADRDGVPNVYEYFKGRMPVIAADVPPPDYIVNSVQGGTSSTDNIYATVSEAIAAAPTTTGGLPAYSIIRVDPGTYQSETALSISKRVLIMGVTGAGLPVLQSAAAAFQPIKLNVEHIAFENLQIELNEWPLGGQSASLRVGVYVELPSVTSTVRFSNCVFPCRVFDTATTALRSPLWVKKGDVTLAHSTIFGLESNALVRGVFLEDTGHVTLLNSLIWLAPGYSTYDLAYHNSLNTVDGADDLSLPQHAALRAAKVILAGSIYTSNYGENKSISPFDRYGHLRNVSTTEYPSYVALHALAGTSGPYPGTDMDGESRIVTTPTKPHAGADQLTDADSDGLPDWWELKQFGSLSQTANGDPDGERLTNILEYKLGFNPNDADSDDDGVNDLVEALALRADPWFPQALRLDTDGDGLDGATELLLGSNPLVYDTNNDGISDGQALAMGFDPLGNDYDGDSLTNIAEIALGTDPYSSDTDHDGHNDNVDAFPLDPAKWVWPASSPADTTAPTITLLKPSGAVVLN